MISRWLLLALLLASPLAAAAPAGGLGPYRLGMTPAQVSAVKDCSPYTEVKSTGGLECPAFPVAGKKRNISFIFDSQAGLKKIQLWFYEGNDATAAETAIAELLAWLSKQHGELESPAVPAGTQVTARALATAAAQQGKVQLKPKQNPKDSFVFASVFHDPKNGWFVFCYVQPPR